MDMRRQGKVRGGRVGRRLQRRGEEDCDAKVWDTCQRFYERLGVLKRHRVPRVTHAFMKATQRAHVLGAEGLGLDALLKDTRTLR